MMRGPFLLRNKIDKMDALDKIGPVNVTNIWLGKN